MTPTELVFQLEGLRSSSDQFNGDDELDSVLDGIHYRSMIAIQGVPLFPPLMTMERRKEMAALRQQAVLIQNRLENEKKKSEIPSLGPSSNRRVEPEEPSRSPSPGQFPMERRNSYTVLDPSPVLLQTENKHANSNGVGPRACTPRSLHQELDTAASPPRDPVLEKQIHFLEAMKDRMLAEHRAQLDSLFQQQKHQIESLEKTLTLPRGFGGLPGLVRGHLTRRLFKTEKVRDLINRVKDSTQFCNDLQNDIPNGDGGHVDVEQVDQVIRDLTAALEEIHEVFFVWPVKQRMALISQLRENGKRKLQRRQSWPNGSIDGKQLFRNLKNGDSVKSFNGVKRQPWK